MNKPELPYAPEAETSVLGGMLIDPAALARAMELLEPRMFHVKRHEIIFAAAKVLFSRGEPVEPITLPNYLTSTGEFESAGGYAFMAELLDSVPTAANIDYWCEIVRAHAQMRSLVKAGQQIVQAVHQRDGKPIAEIVDYCQQVVFESIEFRRDSGPVQLARTLKPTLEQIEAYQAGETEGISTGLVELDEMTGGFRPGDFVVFAGRPSMGKTAIVVGCGLNAALTQRIPTAIFSLEMSKEEVTQRMLCFETMVNLRDLRRKKGLRDDDYVKLAGAFRPLQDAPLWIDDSGGLTLLQLRARARRLKLERPDLGLVIIDYVQLMNGDGEENRTQEVSTISRGLKALAKELQVVVVALSQLSRKPEERGDKRPHMSDLRESGSLEQDADLVGLLYRPEYYFGDFDTKGVDLRGKAELIIGKQRNGPTGTVHLHFHKECTRFDSVAPSWAPASA